MEQIRYTIEKNIRKHNLGERIQDRIIEQKLISIWEQVVSEFLPEASKQTMALRLESGVLYVASLCAETAKKIEQIARRIVYELNSKFDRVIVYSLYLEA